MGTCRAAVLSCFPAVVLSCCRYYRMPTVMSMRTGNTLSGGVSSCDTAAEMRNYKMAIAEVKQNEYAMAAAIRGNGNLDADCDSNRWARRTLIATGRKTKPKSSEMACFRSGGRCGIQYTIYSILGVSFIEGRIYRRVVRPNVWTPVATHSTNPKVR